MVKQMKVIAIFIAAKKGDPMQQVNEVVAVSGLGLMGDRYFEGAGSYSMGKVGRRQVSLINSRFFAGSGFEYADSRRNIIVENVDLMLVLLMGEEFQVGDAILKPVKYCDPCMRPTALSKKDASFKDEFEECGGLIAEVIKTGMIETGSPIVIANRGY